MSALFFNPYVYSSTSLYTMTFPFTFYNASTVGAVGPNISTLVSYYNSTYSSQTWFQNTSYFNLYSSKVGYQLWTCPQTRTYTVTCAGAYGGQYGTVIGGPGGIITASLTLTSGNTYIILVGQTGKQGQGGQGGGGGWSGIIDSTNTTYPLLLAAGGGGGGSGGTAGSPTVVRTGAVAPIAASGGILAYIGSATYNADWVGGTYPAHAAFGGSADGTGGSNNVVPSNGSISASGGFPSAGAGGQSGTAGGAGSGYDGATNTTNTACPNTGTMYSSNGTYTFNSSVTNNGPGYVTIT